jgi:hypothetical protein
VKNLEKYQFYGGRPVGLSFLKLNFLSIDVLGHLIALLLRFRLDFEIFMVPDPSRVVRATARHLPPAWTVRGGSPQTFLIFNKFNFYTKEEL